MKKKTLYVDMDGVIADFDKAIKQLNSSVNARDYEGTRDVVDAICEANPEIFHHLEPIPDAIEHVTNLFSWYDVYFLSTPMWNVPLSFTGKRLWIEKHFGELSLKRLILTHRKDLNVGHYLVDDNLWNGVENFTGMHIHFGSGEFPDWPTVSKFLIKEYYEN